MYSSFRNFGHSFKLAYFSSLNAYKNSDTVGSVMIHISNEIQFNAIFSATNKVKFIFKEKGCNENKKVQKSLCTHIITMLSIFCFVPCIFQTSSQAWWHSKRAFRTFGKCTCKVECTAKVEILVVG